MKIKSKFQLGGIAEAVDSSLDGLGTWGKLGVQILDPTGITGWKDLGDAVLTFLKEGTLKSVGNLGLAALGAMPVIGALGKVGKAEKIVDATADTAKVTSKLVSKSKKLFDADIYRRIVDPNDVNILKMSKWFSSREILEAKNILGIEILKVYEWASKKKMKELPKGLQEKVNKLQDKISLLETKAKPNFIADEISKIEALIYQLEKSIKNNPTGSFVNHNKIKIEQLQQKRQKGLEIKQRNLEEMKLTLV